LGKVSGEIRPRTKGKKKGEKGKQIRGGGKTLKALKSQGRKNKGKTHSAVLRGRKILLGLITHLKVLGMQLADSTLSQRKNRNFVLEAGEGKPKKGKTNGWREYRVSKKVTWAPKKGNTYRGKGEIFRKGSFKKDLSVRGETTYQKARRESYVYQTSYQIRKKNLKRSKGDIGDRRDRDCKNNCKRIYKRC